MESKDLYWLAGWLEGEGSFVGCSGKKMMCKIQAVSTDEDVIKRVADLLGVKHWKQNRRAKDKSHWKDTYRAILCGEKARDLMKELFPLMGERRKEQIKKAIDNYKPRDIKFTEQIIKEIKFLANTMSQNEIAKQFNTARTTVNKIINDKYGVIV